MAFFPVFLSAVFVVRNQEKSIEQMVRKAVAVISGLVSDFEIIVVDNASDDGSVAVFKRLTGQSGQVNLQVYALSKEVDSDTAAWVGLENALGDFVAVIDPLADDVDFLPEMLDKASSGADVVFARNQLKSARTLMYRGAHAAFSGLYKWINGIHLDNDAPNFRLLSKRVVNFILQHPQPAITYRHLPATGGFSRVNLIYEATPKATISKPLGESIDRGVRLLVSTTRAPMRLVTSLSLFGAIANLFYTAYIVAIALLKPDVAPGWVSLSLQQSGMFFLISLVLLVLGEYILNMVRLSNEGPAYYVAQEFTSVRLMRREKLNLEVIEPTLPIATSDQ